MESMRAARIDAYGGPEVLVVRPVDVPTPGPGEIRVRVHAAGVNPLDWKVRAGFLAQFLPHRLPLTLGWDLSGVVDAVGPGLEAFAVGDPVIARPDGMRDGAFADFIVMDARDAVGKPAALSHVEAAALPLAGTTAWQALSRLDLRQGHTVLIHGGAGGVGHLAVQIARQRGARVVATTGGADRAFVADLGADEVIDHEARRFEEQLGPQSVDAVLDLIGGEVYDRSLDVVRRGGAIATTVAFPDEGVAAAKGIRAAFVNNAPDAEALREVAGLAGAGQLRPHIHGTFPLEGIGDALAALAEGRVRGKLVIEVNA